MGVVSNNWFGFALNDLQVQTLMLTDVSTPFFTPLVPLKLCIAGRPDRYSHYYVLVRGVT